MAIFRKVTEALARAAQGVERLTSAVEALREVQGDGDVKQRLQALELGQQKWEAGIEALIMRAEGKFRAARASEERARNKGRGILDDDDETPETADGSDQIRDMAQVPRWDATVGDHAQPSGQEGLPNLSTSVGSARHALLAKFGIAR